MTYVPETGEFEYIAADVPTVYDEGDDSIIGIILGPDEEVISVLYRKFGYGKASE